MVSPYFEGAESSPGLGFPQFQGSMGVWGLKPEDMTQTGRNPVPSLQIPENGPKYPDLSVLPAE